MKRMYDSYPFTSRRDFLKGAAATAAALSMGPMVPGFASAAEASRLVDPKQAPYITTITPDVIADNNKGWLYYGTESGDTFGPNVGGKAQMKPEEFDKNAIVLKCSCYYPDTGDIGHGIHWETFNYLEYLFEGRLKFERYFGQTLHSLADGWKALRSGLVEFGQTYHLHNQGAFDLSHADGLPFLSNSNAHATQIMESVYTKYFKPEYEKQSVLMGFIPHFGIQGLVSKSPIRKLEDLKGLRVMVFGGEVAKQAMTTLGATVVSLPTPDIFIGLQRGVIDAVAWAVGSILTWRYHEICKYVTVTGLAETRIDYGINPASWKKWPADFKKDFYHKLRMAGNHMSEGYTKLEDRGFDDLKKVGVEVIILPPEEKARWNAVGDQTWEWFIKKNEDKGLPARALCNDLRASAAKYNAMSIRQLREYVADPKNMFPGMIDGYPA
jgi:TRAP-type C4-dicarboxylate transport system substrate-binding protein